MKKTAILIYGGEGNEHEISQKSAENLYAAIDKNAFDVIPVLISKSGNWYINEGFKNENPTPTFPVMLNSISGILTDEGIIEVDVAIPALHGDFGEDGIIQGTLDAAHIPYVGCRVGASAICCDKVFTKIIAEHLGIPTAKYTVAESGKSEGEVIDRAKSLLHYPMFVKPARLGSSVGTSRAENEEELLSALHTAREYCDRILIEECVDISYELECGFFESGKKTYISASGVILTNGSFYGYGEKYLNKNSPKTAHGTPLNENLAMQAETAAKRLATVIGITQISRIDFFVTKNNELRFNEINTFPGMTKTSLYPLLTEDMGFSNGDFINLLLAEAVR